MPAYFEEDDVEVVFGRGNGGQGGGQGGGTKNRRSPNNNHTTTIRTSTATTHEPSKWQFEQVYDPFNVDDDEEVAEFFDSQWEDDAYNDVENPNLRIYTDPKLAVLNEGVHEIPGSPWAKPAYKPSSRPSDPLPIATYASAVAFVLTVGWVGFLLFSAIWNYSSIGRVVVEVMLALLSFFGLFWNSYFTVSSIFKCFIPSKAFKTNTKYCSMIPEEKPAGEKWAEVTIQIPVYKESLDEVLMPTLKSCMQSRDYYTKQSGGTRCNIVVCDDGMMALLKNNFAAAEMLWETIESTKGKVFKLSKLLQKVPRPSRRHLKGLTSHNVYEVFHRMLFYYHYEIGFVARSTWDRRGKFKKASNLNAHLRLVWGAEQISKTETMTMEESYIQASHNSDGSRFTMFGNDIAIGDLIIVNDADARMSEAVILKTVPEFLNDPFLGFTQHATKTLDDQRGESFFINMLSAYTDALYQGHFLLSSILGCHPPLVGHSIFLRSEAVKQCGRIRTLRKTQRWLNNIGLPFLSVDQVGLNNLQDQGSTEYWSENHVSEDFELMIHLYNLGFNGRYVAYPDCEFQEGITRTFDEEAGRHRKFALGAHELMFNPFNNWVGQGVFSELFRNFLRSDIPSYYKIFLTAYLFSYTSGGAYILVFTIAAIARIVDKEGDLAYISAFNSAGVLALSVVVYYIIGYMTFLVTMIRMRIINKNLLFPEYRKRGILYLVYMKVRYCMFFQLLFYSVMGNYFFLGSMDHLMARSSIVSATNKDSIHIGRCTAFLDVIRFNSGSWMIAFYILALCYTTLLESLDWDYMALPDEEWIYPLLFAGPAALMAILTFIVPIILNPYVLGWPFNPPLCACLSKRNKKQKEQSKPNKHRRTTSANGKTVDLHTFMATDPAKELDKEIDRVANRPDIELGSLATYEMGGSKYPMSIGSPRKARDTIALVRNGKENTIKAMPGLERPLGRTSSSRNTRGGAASSRREAPHRVSSSQQQPGRSSAPSSSQQPARNAAASNQNRVKLAMI